MAEPGAGVPAPRGCKGCGDQFRVSEEQLARVLASPAFAPERCVPDDVYRERLDSCAPCEKLLDGTTCALCGCIIPVVAKLRERACPLPGGGRWAAYAE